MESNQQEKKHWAIYTAAMPENAQNILEIDIPKGSKILSFGELEGKLAVWFLAPTDKDPEMQTHKFYLLTDGGMVCEDNMKESKFIGSVNWNGNGWHCFQI